MKIICVVNERGGAGKTTFMYHWEDAFPDSTCVLDGAKARDCYNLAKSSRVRRVVFFHLTRNEGGDADFKAVEDMKVSTSQLY